MNTAIRMDNKDKRAGITLLEIVLILSILVLAAVTIIPTIDKTRDAVAVELVSRNLQTIEDAIRIILRNTPEPKPEPEDITLDMVEQLMDGMSRKLIEWPEEADLSTLDMVSTNGPTMLVNLRSGPYTVTTEDVTSPR